MNKIMAKGGLRIVITLLLVVGVGVAYLYRDSMDAAVLDAWLKGLGKAGPFVFVLLYALASVLFVPGSVLTLAGGVMFGPLWGTLFNLSGATLGAVLAFVLARTVASEWVEEKSAGRLAQMQKGVEAEGWRFVVFVRLVPLFPFNVLNYVLGLTRIPLSTYTITSFFSMLPGALAYTYIGFLGREALTDSEGLIEKALLGLALLALVLFLPGFIRRLRYTATIDP